MKFVVTVMKRAWDADRSFEWFAACSPQGAIRWHHAFEETLMELESNADQFAVAAESAAVGVEVRQKLFRTRRGRTYRLLFTIVDREVRVLRVRGPGQPTVSRDDIIE